MVVRKFITVAVPVCAVRQVFQQPVVDQFVPFFGRYRNFTFGEYPFEGLVFVPDRTRKMPGLFLELERFPQLKDRVTIYPVEMRPYFTNTFSSNE